MKRLILITMSLALFMTLPLRADERVIREHSFNLADIEEIQIKGGVGQLRITLVEGEALYLVLDIEGQKSGLFRRARQVDDVDLKSRISGRRLVLEMDESNISTEWTVAMPAVPRTLIDFGVGEVLVTVGDTELDLNLGVGDVHVTAPLHSTGDIDLAVGVGDASVRGGQIIERRSRVVSHEIKARGEGAKPIRAHVGVGEISLRLE